jgi:hypothetical protein
VAAGPPHFRLTIVDFRFGTSRAQASILKNLKLAICNRKFKWRQGDYAPANASDNVPFCWILPSCLAGFGGKGIRTPDFQLAKLALYQLSYAPVSIADCRLWIADCKSPPVTKTLFGFDYDHLVFLEHGNIGDREGAIARSPQRPLFKSVTSAQFAVRSKRKCRMSILQSSSGICRCAAAKTELCVTVSFL